MKNQNTYCINVEEEDLNKMPGKSVHGRFIAGAFVLPILEASLRRAATLKLSYQQTSDKLNEVNYQDVGALVYKTLINRCPEIQDYLNQRDFQEIAECLREF